jgi:hypothetical protein
MSGARVRSSRVARRASRAVRVRVRVDARPGSRTHVLPIRPRGGRARATSPKGEHARQPPICLARVMRSTGTTPESAARPTHVLRIVALPAPSSSSSRRAQRRFTGGGLLDERTLPHRPDEAGVDPTGSAWAVPTAARPRAPRFGHHGDWRSPVPGRGLGCMDTGARRRHRAVEWRAALPWTLAAVVVFGALDAVALRALHDDVRRSSAREHEPPSCRRRACGRSAATPSAT